METQQAIDEYTLIEKIGEGGMAEVWRARHRRLGSVAAIKFLLRKLAGDPEFERRFLESMTLQAQLEHQNIVSVRDLTVVDGREGGVMQYIDGESLERRLREQRGPLSLDEIHDISWDVLSALSFAHSRGWIHRDVKPANILLSKDGRTFLTDFGIAKAMQEMPDRLKTGTGVMLGTLEYISPEQILRPKAVDHRADIYGFGCVLYAMLTGSPPWPLDEGTTDFNIQDNHVRVPPPPITQKNPSVSPELERVVRKCMAKDPANRYQSCFELKAALDGAILGTKGPAPVKRPVGRKAVWIAAVAGFLLVVGVAFAWRYWTAAPALVALRLEGSTTVGDELAPRLLEHFLRRRMGGENPRRSQEVVDKDGHIRVKFLAKLPGQSAQSFEVTANGSGNAFTALAGGTTDIGMSSRPVKDEEAKKLSKIGDMKSSASENIVAMDGIAIVVNNGNPSTQLDKAKVREIFAGRITDWGDLPGGTRGPIRCYGRDTKSGTFDSFVALVMDGKKDAIAKSVKIEPTGDAIAQAVSSDAGGIGFTGLAQVKGVRALAISDGAGTVALYPSSFTVSTEDYVLSRRLFLYVPAKTSQLAREFLNFATGPDGQTIVKDVGYVEQSARFEQIPVDPNAPPRYRDHTSGKRRMRINFRFRPNSSDFDNKALADKERARRELEQSNLQRGIVLLGFADSKGDSTEVGRKHNCALSLNRAVAVQKEFEKIGVAAEAYGLCSAMPVADNKTDPGREKNRRVEVWVP